MHIQCLVCKCESFLTFYDHLFDIVDPVNTEQNYLDHDLDRNLDYDLDCNPEDVPSDNGYSLFNTTKRITLLFIVQSWLHFNPPNI